MRTLSGARRAWAASAAVAVAFIVGSSIAQATTQDTSKDTSIVSQGDLVETMSWSGELAYANATTLEYRGGQGDTSGLRSGTSASTVVSASTVSSAMPYAAVAAILAGSAEPSVSAEPSPSPSPTADPGGCQCSTAVPALTPTTSVFGGSTGASTPATPSTEAATTTGLVTWLPAANSTVGNGGVLYRVDNAPVVLLEGAATLYRDLSSGDTGADVEALEAALAALGYGQDMTVDETFTAATAAALEDFQAGVGLEVTGALDLATVVMHDGPVVVSTLVAAVGDEVTAGVEMLVVADPQRDVTLALDPSELTSIAVGDPMSIMLLDGSRADASVTSIASAPADDGTYTLVARLDPAAQVLGDHLTVEVSAQRVLAQDALLIDPFALVLLESNRTVVRVLRGDEVVDVEVTVIATAGRVTAVESDALAEGDMMGS